MSTHSFEYGLTEESTISSVNLEGNNKLKKYQLQRNLLSKMSNGRLIHKIFVKKIQ